MSALFKIFTGILFNDVLIPKLLNNPFACCSLINFDFLLPHMVHFDKIIILPLTVSETFGFIFSVFFLHYNTNIFTCLFNHFLYLNY